MKIGDIIWYRPADGAAYLHLFNKAEILGETSRSWLVLPPGHYAKGSDRLERYAEKLPKNLKDFEIGNEQRSTLVKWAQRQRYAISDKVTRCGNENILLTIARMVGHEHLPEGFKL